MVIAGNPPPPPPMPPALSPALSPLPIVDAESGTRATRITRITADKPPPPWFITAMNLLNTITHLCLGAISFFVIFVATWLGPPPLALRQHMFLCVIGYVLLMSQAVLSLNPYNGWSRALKHPQKRTIHWVMQIIGSSLAIAGSIIRIVDYEGNFDTAHGVLGLIALLLTFISLIGGVVNFFSDRIPVNANVLKLGHEILGSTTLLVAFTALCFGFGATFFRDLTGDPSTNTAIFLTVVAMIGTLLSPFIRIFEGTLTLKE